MIENIHQDKIKIMRLIARLNVGGPAIHTILLTQGLDKEKFYSLLVTGVVDKNESDMSYLAKNKNVSPIVIPNLGRRLNFIKDLAALVTIFNLIRREKPDILHTHTAKAGALGRLSGALYNIICGRRKCRLIHTFHGTVLQGYFGKTKTAIFIWIERMLGSFTDRIIVVSESLRNELLDLKIGTPQKISVVRLGLDMDGLFSLRPDTTALPPRIGIIGRLSGIKNHRMFLDAARLLVTSQLPGLDKCKFIIIGDGELRPDLEAYASLTGIKESVEFRGVVKEPALIYGSLDIVALSSLNEGTPLCLIEAMAAGLPIVATNVGGVKDLFFKSPDSLGHRTGRVTLFDNGIMCDSLDALGLAKALRILLENTGLRKKMGEAGRSFVRERFSKERLIKDMELLYNMALKRRLK